MIHELKCVPKFWPYYKNGDKNNSLRKNDRRFAVGDICILRLWEDERFIVNEITIKRISHIVHDYEFKEIPNGYCLLSFKETK